jgi:hypothetical protein
MAFSWSKTDQSLSDIRGHLKEDLLPFVNQAFDSLLSGLEANVGHERVADLVDAAVHARTEFQAVVEYVSNWFRRSRDVERDPFEMDVAVGVAFKEIGNCYVKSPIISCSMLSVPYKISGSCLEGVVDVLFLLLQNVIRHSGFQGEQEVDVHVGVEQEWLVIEVVNDLAESISIEERREVADEAVRQYERDTAMRMARVEGGSGLSKIWRILEYDLKTVHELRLEVTDERKFVSHVKMSSTGIRAC